MAATTLLQQVNIFISSPGDMGAERRAVAEVVMALNQDPLLKDRYVFVPLAYEHEVPPKAGQEPQLIVDRYMRAAKDCYLVVCMFWNRMGTPFTLVDENSQQKKTYGSGTHYEFMTAYRSQQATGTPQLLLYRKTQSTHGSDPQQQQMVNQFFSKFEGDNKTLRGLYQRFDTPEEFSRLFATHLRQILNHHPPENTGRMIRPQDVRAYQQALDLQVWEDVLGALDQIKQELQQTREREAIRTQITTLQARQKHLQEQRDDALVRQRDARDELRMSGDIQRAAQGSAQGTRSMLAIAAAALSGILAAVFIAPLIGLIVGVVVLIVLLLVFRTSAANRTDHAPSAVNQIEAEIAELNTQLRQNTAELETLYRKAKGRNAS